MKQLGKRDTERVARLTRVILDGGPLDASGRPLSDEAACSTIARFGLDCYNAGDLRGFVKGIATGIFLLVSIFASLSWLTGVHFAPVAAGYHVEYVSDGEPLARIDE